MSYRYGALTVLLGFEFHAANKLLKASDQGDIKTVCRVLDRKPQLAVFTGFSGTFSPLHRAVNRGDEAMCREILKSMAAYSEKNDDNSAESLLLVVANQKSHKGLTPLMMACEIGHRGIVEILLEAGADPREYDQYTSRTCLHYAAMAGKADIVQFLTGDSVTWEHEGSRLPLRECVMPDIQVGSSKYIDQRSFGGLTPLHFAAVAGSLECSKILLQRGAAIMVKTDGDAFIGDEYLNPGSTPLHIAVLTNNISIAHTIIAAHTAMMNEGPMIVYGAGRDGQQQRGRRAWEGSSRTDIRSVRNSHRKLPYHLARERRRRDLMHLVDPRISVESALDEVRDAQLGLGAMRLSSICSQVIQSSLLNWLDDFEKSVEERDEIHAGEGGTSPFTANGEIQELVLPKLPAILARRASLPPRLQSSLATGTETATAIDDARLSPTFWDELSPISSLSATGNNLTGGNLHGITHGCVHGHHATADDFLLDRISTQLVVVDHDEEGEEQHNNANNNASDDILPAERPPLIRVHSESGLSQLAAFGRRFGSRNNSLTTPAGLGIPRFPGLSSFPETPDAMIKSESFENDHETKDSDSTGTGSKASISSGSTDGGSTGDHECGVCFDATVDVEFTCGHQLCLECSRSLTLQNKRPPLCPFCRQHVYGFKRAIRVT